MSGRPSPTVVSLTGLCESGKPPRHLKPTGLPLVTFTTSDTQPGRHTVRSREAGREGGPFMGQAGRQAATVRGGEGDLPVPSPSSPEEVRVSLVWADSLESMTRTSHWPARTGSARGALATIITWPRQPDNQTTMASSWPSGPPSPAAAAKDEREEEFMNGRWALPACLPAGALTHLCWRR